MKKIWTLVGLILSSGSVFATASSYVRASAAVGNSTTWPQYAEEHRDGGIIASEASAEGHLTSGSTTKSDVRTFARARMGSVHALAETRADGAEKSGASALAHAVFSDSIAFGRPDLAGQSGTVSIAFHMHGNVAAEAFFNEQGGRSSSVAYNFTARFGNAYASMIEALTNYGTFYNHQMALHISDLDTEISVRQSMQLVPTFFVLTQNITWGGYMPISLEVMVHSNSEGTYGYSSGLADASHSGYWAGIVSAYADGEEITDFSVTSASGVDYARSFVPAMPVPEPGMLALVIPGVLMTAAVQRRRVRAFASQPRLQ